MMPVIDFFFLDLETTGLNPTTDEIIEIGCVHTRYERSRLRVLDDFHCLVLPINDPPPNVAAINGFDRKAWYEQNAFGKITEALEHFESWLAGRTESRELCMWAGSNVAGFDLRFLRSFGPPFGAFEKFSHRTLSTESLCLPLYLQGEAEGTGLRHLRKWVGIKGDQKHRALEDTYDAYEVARQYLSKLGIIQC